MKTDGDVAHLVEHRTGTPLRLVRFPGAARDFSPRVDFQYRLSYSVRTPLCAIACINICAHAKNPAVVHIRVRWIMETIKHPAGTVAWVARLCRSWLFPKRATVEFLAAFNCTVFILDTGKGLRALSCV